VWQILKRAGIDPAPRRDGPGWHRLPSAAEDLQVIIPRRNRALLLQGKFCITLLVVHYKTTLFPMHGFRVVMTIRRWALLWQQCILRPVPGWLEVFDMGHGLTDYTNKFQVTIDPNSTLVSVIVSCQGDIPGCRL
jgi:hypothetical protein